MGAAMDRELARARWAMRARWPEWAPSDALAYIGVERSLERVTMMGTRASEDEGTYRRRLREGWTIWTRGGSQQIHQDSFRWTGLTNVSVYRRHEWSMPSDAGCPSRYVQVFQHSVWAQFDILIDYAHPWRPVRWGDGHRWGTGWTWGSTATVPEIEQLRRLARRFRAGHDTPMWIYLNQGRGRVWGAWVWGDGGLWGGETGATVRWLVGEPHWRARGLV